MRRPRGDERQAGAAALPRGGHRRSRLRLLHRGEQGAVRAVRRDITGGRGPLDGGGLPRGRRPRAHRRDSRPRSEHRYDERSASSSACPSRSASPGPRRWRRWRAERPSPTACSSWSRSASASSSTRSPSRTSGESASRRRQSSTDSASGPSVTSPSTREASLVLVLGKSSGRHLHALANLRDRRPVQPTRKRSSFGSQSALGSRQLSQSEVDSRLAALVERTTRRMRDAGRCGRTVVLRLRFDDYTRATRSHTLPRSTAATGSVLLAARKLLRDAEPAIRRKGLTLVGVSISNLEPPGCRRPARAPARRLPRPRAR